MCYRCFAQQDRRRSNRYLRLNLPSRRQRSNSSRVSTFSAISVSGRRVFAEGGRSSSSRASPVVLEHVDLDDLGILQQLQGVGGEAEVVERDVKRWSVKLLEHLEQLDVHDLVLEQLEHHASERVAAADER